MKTLQTDYGCIVIGSQPLGKGGRGSVFPLEHVDCALAELPAEQLACKLVDPRHRSPGRKGKVELLSALARPADTEICWPLASVYEEGAWVGYVMRKASGRPLDEAKSDRSLGLEEKVRLAARMCDLVERMHGAGIVIGDVNLANFLYCEETDSLALIDLDSAQVADAEQGAVYPTTESRAKSPEMLEGRLGQTLLTSRSDRYLLAVEVFRLLFDAHPLDEYLSDTPSEEVRLANTRNRRFGFNHVSSCCGADSLGPDLFRLFCTSFEGPYETIPSARDYAACLRSLENEAFAPCPRCGFQRVAERKSAWLSRHAAISRMKDELRPLAPYAAAGGLMGLLVTSGCVDPLATAQAAAGDAANFAQSLIEQVQGVVADVAEGVGSALANLAAAAEEAVRELADEAKAAARTLADEAALRLNEADRLLRESWDELFGASNN